MGGWRPTLAVGAIAFIDHSPCGKGWMSMKKRIALGVFLGSGVLIAMCALIFYLDPSIMEKTYIPYVPVGVAFSGLITYMVASSGKARDDVSREPAVSETGEVQVEEEEAKEEEAVDECQVEAHEEVSDLAGARRAVVTLLSMLQKEGRFVDFLEEDLDAYSDEQVGAAAREVHKGCRGVLNELFSLAPVIEAEEGSTLELEEDFDKARIELVGRVQGLPPFRGVLRHGGWRYTRFDMPHGAPEAEEVISRAEVEVV